MIVLLALILTYAFFVIYCIKWCQTGSIPAKFLFLFLLEWGGVFFLSIYSHHFGIDEIKGNAYICLFLFVVFFSIPVLLLRKKNITIELDKAILQDQIERLCSNILFRVFFIVCFVYVISLYVKFWQILIINQALSEMRSDFFDGSLYGNGFILINGFVLVPLATICSPIFGFKLVYKRDWTCLFLGIFLFCFYSLGGGRFGYVQIVLAILFSVMIFKIDKKKKKKFLFLSVIGAIFLYGVFVFVTGSRTGNVDFDNDSISKSIEDTNNQLVKYPLGASVAFSYAINEGKYVERIGGYKYGQMSFSSIFDLFFMLSKYLGMPIPTALADFVQIKQYEYISISEKGLWNALYTAPMFFYLDLGWIGIVVFSLFWGKLYSLIIFRALRMASLPDFILLFLFFYKFFFSIFDFCFEGWNTLVIASVLLLLSNRCKCRKSLMIYKQN